MKKKMITAAIAVSMSLMAASCADSGDADGDATAATAQDGTINGTWKIDVDSAAWENDIDRYLLQDGTYNCESCTPPFSLAADGEWHELDRPGSDSQMVEVVDERTVKTAARLDGKDLGNSTWTVSEDGQTMKLEFNNLSGDSPVNGKVTFNRVEAGPEGAHAMSGAWQIANVDSMSEEGLTFDINVDGDQYTNSGNGQRFTAILGGDPVAIEGSDTNTMVAVEKVSDNSYRETYTRDGETTGIVEFTVGEDGTLNAVSTDPRDGSVVRYSASRS